MQVNQLEDDVELEDNWDLEDDWEDIQISITIQQWQSVSMMSKDRSGPIRIGTRDLGMFMGP